MISMGKWDDEREWLKAARDVAEDSQERAMQEYDIVITQQESLWESLTTEFSSAVDNINIGSGSAPLLRIHSLKGVRGFTIIAHRPKNIGTATVVFNSQLKQVTINFTKGGDASSLKYTIRANEQNRAEFSQQNMEAITNDGIVSDTISHLR